jgi:hypothetical protein
MDNKALWPFLFLAGTLLFNWPFLSIFSLSLPYYLFGVWGMLILLVSVFIAKAGREKDKGV